MLKKGFICLVFFICFWVPAIQAQAEEAVNVTAIPRSDPGKRTNLEQRNKHHSAFEVTGIFLPKGEEIVVEVTEDPENAQLKVGQWGQYDGVENVTNGKINFGDGSINLVKGENRFSNTKTGGMVYINNLSATQTLHVKITGGKQVPLYIQGTTDIEAFKTALSNAQDVPFMELANDKVIATIRIDRAKDIFLKGNQADDFLTFAKETVDLEEQAADLYADDQYSANKAPQRLHIANPTSGAGTLYCADYYIGIHSGSSSDQSVFKSKPGESSWGLFHEIGHSYQNPYYTWTDMGEVTVNIYSNYVKSHMAGLNSPYDAVENKTGNNVYRRPVKRYFDNKAKDPTWSIEKEIAKYKSDYHFGVLGLFVGLERAFGDDFYPALNRAYRTMPDTQLPSENVAKQQMFIIQTSKLTQTDLTPYFDFWGVPITAETRKELDSLNYPVLEKEIWKDLLATEAEEKAGTYRLSNQVQTVKSYPRATQIDDVTQLKVQELNRLDVNTYFTDLHSEPIPSDVTKLSFGNADFWNLSTQTSKVFLENELGIGERIEFKFKVIPQDTYVMSGQKGVYMVLDYDKVNQELVAKGRKVQILPNIPNNTYPIVTIYNENYEMKKEVIGKGSTYGNDFASQLDREKLVPGDIVKIYHKEAEKRSMRYLNGTRIETTEDTYYYKITEDGWLPVEPKPIGNGVERTIRIGEEVAASDMVTDTDPVIGKQLKIAWSVLPVYAGNFGKDELTNTQEVSVKLTNILGENKWIFTNLTIKRGDSLKITGQSDQEKISMVVNSEHQLRVYGAKSSFHTGSYKDKNYSQIQIFSQNGSLKKEVRALGKDTATSVAEQLHNMQLEVGDYIMVTQAEGVNHLFSYKNDEVAPKKLTTGNLITYQVTNAGWEQVVVQPHFTSQNQTYQIGQTPAATDFVSTSEYLFGTNLLSFKWGTQQPTALNKGVTLSEYLQQQVSIEAFVSQTSMEQATASLNYRLNNTINVTRHGGFGTFIIYEPITQKLIAQGADPYTLNGSNKDTTTPLVTIDLLYQDANKTSQTIQAFNNTTASELTNRINKANLQLEIGDIVKITHARQNQAGVSLDEDTKKYVTKAMTAFIDNQKIEQFSGTSQYYLVTPTGLELHQDSLNLTGKVMIHYLDETGQPLQTATELTGELGQSFTLPVPTFENYQLTEAPTELTGTFTRSLQEYTFIYERKAGGDITVQYMDEQGNQLADEEVLKGKIDEAYQAQEKVITGYQVKDVPPDHKGTFSETAKTIVFIYEPVAAAPVTIKYQDETGTEIAPTETMTGKFNETYQVYPKNLADWVLKEQPAATTGIFTLTPQTLIFIYERAKGQMVYVQYLNEQQEMIAPTESLEGKVGETYQATAKDLSGWRLKQQPTNASGTFTNEIQYVTYLYEKIVTGDVKIYYQDNDDNHLLPMETVTGEVGTAFHIPTKDIPGYILKETVGTLVGNYTKETQAIFFKYERKTASAITVNYIDIDSGEILETVSLSGKIGDPYSIELKEIPGYTLVLEAIKQRASFIQGIFGEQQPAEILITYRKNAVNDQPTTDTDDKDPSAESIDPEDRPQNGSKIEEESVSTGAALDANKIKNAANDQAMKQKTESKPTLANNAPKSAETESADLPKTNEKNYSWLSIITGLSVWLLLTASLLYLRRVYKV